MENCCASRFIVECLINNFRWFGGFLTSWRKIKKQNLSSHVKDFWRYRTEHDDFLRCTVPCDETWVHQHPKHVKMKWQKSGEVAPWKVMIRLFAKKVFATIFWISEAYCLLLFFMNSVQLMLQIIANWSMTWNSVRVCFKTMLGPTELH